MPGFPRPKGKPQKIAYAILGRPSNMLDTVKKSGNAKKVENQLVFEETSRVR